MFTILLVTPRHMHLKDLFPLRLRCAARCDRYRNADSVSISAALSLTIAAQRSRSVLVVDHGVDR